MKEFLDRLKHHFDYNHEERRDMLIAAIAAGFIFSFNDWGKEIFNPVDGVINWIIVSIIALLSISIHISVQKAAALKRGFKPVFRLWKGGISAGLLVIFGSLGRLPLPLVGGIEISPMKLHRLGESPYSEEFRHNAWISMVGIISTLFLYTFAKVLSEIFSGSYILNKLLIINIAYVIVSLLPIPKLDGLNIFFFNSAGYLIFILFILIYAVSIYMTGIIYSIFIAVIAAAALPYISKLVYGKINKDK